MPAPVPGHNLVVPFVRTVADLVRRCPAARPVLRPRVGRGRRRGGRRGLPRRLLPEVLHRAVKHENQAEEIPMTRTEQSWQWYDDNADVYEEMDPATLEFGRQLLNYADPVPGA